VRGCAPLPSQDRVRAYQQQELAQLVHQEVMEQVGEDRTVGVREGGLAGLALRDQQLVRERRDLDVLVSIAHRQQAQEREGAGRGEVGHAQ
jgi:hypothetical protein